MKVAIFTFLLIAVIYISTANGTFIKPISSCSCPPQQTIYQPVYINTCQPQPQPPTSGGGDNNKNCNYKPCSQTDLPMACGAVKGQCKMYSCMNEIFNKNCASGATDSSDSKIENVNMKYCQGMSVGGSFAPCKNL